MVPLHEQVEILKDHAILRRSASRSFPPATCILPVDDDPAFARLLQQVDGSGWRTAFLPAHADDPKDVTVFDGQVVSFIAVKSPFS
jgi:hypothetical protein